MVLPFGTTFLLAMIVGDREFVTEEMNVKRVRFSSQQL